MAQDPKADYSVSLEHPSYMDMTPTSLFFGFWLGYFFIGGIIVGVFIWLEKHRRYQHITAISLVIKYFPPKIDYVGIFEFRSNSQCIVIISCAIINFPPKKYPLIYDVHSLF